MSDFFSAVLSVLNAIWPYAVAALCFVFLIIAHEFGHFVAARIAGIKVHQFSVGFGPTLIKIKGKKTDFFVKAIPLGGYCAMEGEDAESDHPDAFCNKKPWKRLLVVVMGAVFNLLLGLVLVAVMLSPGNAFVTNEIEDFNTNAVSSQSLKKGDIIVEIGGRPVATPTEIAYTFSNVKNDTIDITVVRNGKSVPLNDVKFNTFTEKGYNMITVDFSLKAVKKNFGNYVATTFKTTFSYVKIVWWSLVDIITGRYGISALSGPVGATAIIGDVARQNLLNLLPICALLTVNLGIFNLLPLPALDGGRALFIIFEMIFRRPVLKKQEPLIHTLGFILLFAFLIGISGKDIIQLIFG
ncbi:MAG: site-2 protease family protein [Oscillospiraceae bacterium]|nr:site-2 protease family protein [Candidatus Equicaccousia limihippi]